MSATVYTETSPPRPAVLDQFESHYAEYASLVGRIGSTIVPADAYAAHPGLYEWVSAVRDAYSAGLLSDTEVGMMQALRDWDWLVDSSEWMCPYRDLEEHLRTNTDVDLALPPAPGAPAVLVWARTQQTGRTTLTASQVAALERLPGWCWTTRLDRVHGSDRDAMRYLAFRGGDTNQLLADHLLRTPVETMAAMLHSSPELCGKVDELLDLAASPGVRDRGALFAAALAGAGDRLTDAACRFIANRLDDFASGHLEMRELAVLGADDSSQVIAAYTGFRDRTSLTHVPAADTTADADADAREEGDCLASRHVAYLGLSVRTYNVLMREGLVRVSDVLAVEDPQQLLRLRGFGVSCLDNLRERLRHHGANPLF